MPKATKQSPSVNNGLHEYTPGSGKPDIRNNEGNAGDLHQDVASGTSDASAYLTDNFGHRISDNQNSLRAGERGPTLLEDFVLREKIFHFDHERIPERIVHARGSGAHGVFECTRAIPELTKASIFQKVGDSCPVFLRFSTVAGGAGSVDTARDVRGVAVKFYTDTGNWDLVGINIPVFFIQDAIKFPDLIHAVKMEADRGYPQAASAHDTFWDFISLMPESMHMLMWAMSDRAIPRSLRMMEGFGVHTFRLVNAKGEGRFVKFHWKPVLGVESTTWDEAVKIAGADPDFHRRDLFQAIEAGDYPQWDLGIQQFDEAWAAKQPYDVLDPTKLIPEEDIPVEIIGRMTLNRNVDNFFAETEQAAFLPTNVIPGIDFSNDPLLQGRLFSYLDTQKSRLGTTNFHQIPINASKCPFHNFQRDGMMQTLVPTGRANYEPNSLAEAGEDGGPRASTETGFTSFQANDERNDGSQKLRIRAEGSDKAAIDQLKKQIEEGGGTVFLVAPKVGGIPVKGGTLKADGQLAGSPSVLFDAVASILTAEQAAKLTKDGAAVQWFTDAYGHCKTIAHSPETQALLDKANVEKDEGVVPIEQLIKVGTKRHWAREPKVRDLA